MNISERLEEIDFAEQCLAIDIDRKWPVGTKLRATFFHDSSPEFEVIMSMSRVGALRCRLLEDVSHRMPGKGIIRHKGEIHTIPVSRII